MSRAEAQKAQELVRDAGGRVVGRTRLQKIGYVLSAVGLEDTFWYSYKHYGPYSEDLSEAIVEAQLLGLLTETEHIANWGGRYSVFQTQAPANADVPPARVALAGLAANADAVALELAATALLLSKQGVPEPWEETARRKPEKADQGRLQNARALYDQFRAINAPEPWPNIE